MSGGGSPERPIEPPSPPGGDRGSPPPCVHTKVIPGGWRRRVLLCQRSTFCSAHWISLASAGVIELCPCGPTIMIMSNLFLLLSSATCSVSLEYLREM